MKNIILLSIDALRGDHVSWLGYGRDTTPSLEEFSRRCMVFESSYAASSHTRESVPALLSGRHPTEAVTDGFTRGAETLPMLLPDEYATAAFHSNPYISRAYDYDEGFDTFYDDLYMGQNTLLALLQRALDKFVLKRGEYHARAEEINDRALSWLSSLPDAQPFFLWNHYMDVHGPYNPPEESAEWSASVPDREAQRLYDRLSGDESLSEEEATLSKNLYDGEIRYVDAQLGRFIDELEARGLLEESLVLITSDHGDLFGEYGQYAHPRYVYPELTRVPLMMFDSDIGSGVSSAPVSTLDFVPTALEISGSMSRELPGKSLLRTEQLDQERFVFSSATVEESEDNLCRFAVQSADRGVRFARNQTTGDICNECHYELPSGNVVNSDDEPEFRSLRAALVEHSEMWLNQDLTVDREEDISTNANIQKRLEALGYK